jgi:ABC-type Zn uptake system ZnuABC Zn-binding protein ZnuA
MLPLMHLPATATKAQTAEKTVIVCTTSAVGNIVQEFLGDTADVVVLVNRGCYSWGIQYA